MTKRQENIRIKKIEKHFKEISKPANDAIDMFSKYVKREIKTFTNYMMYRKRPTNKVDRYADTFIWWFIIVIIFFALKGITYTFTGR